MSNLLLCCIAAAAHLTQAPAPVPHTPPSPPAPLPDPVTQNNARQSWTFDDAAALDGWDLSASGDAARRMPKPKIEDGKLYLLESWSNSTTAVAAPLPPDQDDPANAASGPASVEISFTLVMNTGTEGLGVAWLSIPAHGRERKVPAAPTEPFGPGVNEQAVTLEPWGWEAPNFAGSFAVGFDASNPPNRDPFRGSGNAYDRPQHEVSLHFAGVEIVKKTTETDFRDGEKHAVTIRFEHVTGGALASVSIDTKPVFDRVFIAGMLPYPARLALGARNGPTAGDVLLDDLTVVRGPRITAAPPTRVIALDRALNDKDHPTNEGVAQFPANTSAFGRIICTLRLDKPATRFDPWDRTAHINLVDDSGEVFELIRYITPYHRGYEWHFDVSDFRPLLSGSRRIIQSCSTQGEGWVVSVSFDFYPGPTDRRAIKVVNLWNGDPEIGNPDKPVQAFYQPRQIAVPDGATSAKVRTVITGHGMTPNTANAAEFMSIGRTLTINGVPTGNTLWKTDNYLNPCRPQGGTWKYDRAGWAPGDAVRPWEVEAPPLPPPTPGMTRKLTVEYTLDPYLNETRGKTWAPSHRTEAQVIFYVSD